MGQIAFKLSSFDLHLKY